MEKSTIFSRFMGVFFLILFLIAISAITPSTWVGVKNSPIRTPLDLEAITSAENSVPDSDKNGVITWSEVINNSFKGDEVSLSKIKEKPIDETVIKQLNDPNNLTASFSKNLLLSSAYLKEQGITDKQSKQEIVTRLLQEEAKKITPKKYHSSDIKVLVNEDKNIMKKYGNTIASMLKESTSKKQMTEELTAITIFTQSKNGKDLLPLDKNYTKTELLIKNLLTLEVPPSAVALHLLFLNRLSAYSQVLHEMSLSETDPLRGTIAVQNYVNTSILVIRTFILFSDYFKNQNIVFSEKDNGYIFTVGYTYNK